MGKACEAGLRSANQVVAIKASRKYIGEMWADLVPVFIQPVRVAELSKLRRPTRQSAASRPVGAAADRGPATSDFYIIFRVVLTASVDSKTWIRVHPSNEICEIDGKKHEGALC
jgi:hypothetical protein